MDIGLLNLLGGSGLFLYAIEGMSKSIEYLAGSQLKIVINKFTSNKITSFLVGIFLAFLLNSSGAVSVMLIGLANARLLELERVLVIILGAAIGSTFIVYIFTLNIAEYGLLLITLGITINLLANSNKVIRVGRGFFYLGLIFFSLSLVFVAGKQLQNNELFLFIINYFQDRPVVSFLIALFFTAIIHNSVATIAFVMSLMMASGGTIYQSLPWIFGANLGTTLTAFFASMRNGIIGKKAAASYFLCKFSTVLICFPLIPFIGMFIERNISGIGTQIAIAHTGFNLVLAIIFLPLSNVVVNIVEKMAPSKKEGDFVFNYIDSSSSSPELSLAQAQREILRVSDIVERMLEKCINFFKTRDIDEIEKLKEQDQLVDFLNKGIKLYLTKLSQKEMTPSQVQKEFELFVRINDIENIGDVIVRNILEHALKIVRKGYVFSDEGWHEITVFHDKVLGCLRISTAYFNTKDHALYSKLIFIYEQINEMLMELNETHVKRLHQGIRQTVETVSIHLDLLGNLQRIASLAVNFTKVSEGQN